MKNHKSILLLILILSTMNNNLLAESLENIASKLDIIIEKEMKAKSIPGLQLTLFNPQGAIQKSYGYADQKRQKKVKLNTLFRLGSLRHPLNAYAILNYLKKENTDLAKAIQKPVAMEVGELKLINSLPENKTLVRWSHILGMTSGLSTPPKLFILKENITIPMKKALRQKAFYITTIPGTKIKIAPQGYAYLAEIMRSKEKLNLSSLIEVLLKREGLSEICITLKHCKSSLELNEAQTSLKSNKKTVGAKAKKLKLINSFYFHAPKFDFVFPNSYSLFGNSKDYANLMLKLWKKAKKNPKSPAAYLFHKHKQYDPELGGTGLGFLFTQSTWLKAKSKNHLEHGSIFYVRSSLPGSSAIAFISEQGHGAVLLINKNDLFFLLKLQRYIYDFYGIFNLDNKYQKSIIEDDGLVASYRPDSILPENYSYLNFLNDIQIRYSEEKIELSPVFEKETILNLYPIKKDLYLARGVAEMDGWRIRIRRDKKGDIIALDSNLLRYIKISKFLSAQSIFIIMGLGFGMPISIALFYFIRKKNK